MPEPIIQSARIELSASRQSALDEAERVICELEEKLRNPLMTVEYCKLIGRPI